MEEIKTQILDTHLERKLGGFSTIIIVVANMIGTGIFTTSGLLAAQLPGPGWVLLCWLFGGLIAIAGALCYAELATRMPEAGGEYLYLKKLYHPALGFLAGWTSLIVGFSAPIAAAAMGFSEYIYAGLDAHLFHLGPGQLVVFNKGLAVSVIMIFTALHYLGLRLGSRVQNVLTVIKILIVAGLATLGMIFGNGSGPVLSLEGGEASGIMAVGTAMMFVMFAYSGWNAASYLAGEVRNPGKTLPRSLLLGAGSVVLLYLAVNLVFAYAVPLENVGFADGKVHPTQVPQLAVENLFGARASNVFSVLLGLTFLATVSAFIITGPRVYYAMARDGLFPSIAGRTSPRAGVPTYAMVLQSVCAVVILFVMDFQDLYQYAAVGLSLFALLFIGAVYVLRWRRPEMERPFRVPGYPVVPAIFMAVTLFMAVFAFQQWRTPSLLSVGSILLGIPVYYIWTFIRRRPGTTIEAGRSVD